MRAALAAELNRHPRVRRVLPSLAVVERVLAVGPRALKRLPAAWLRDASVRLEVLTGDSNSDDLRQLRDYLRSLAGVPAAAAGEAQASTHGEVDISETSLTRFLEAGQVLDHQIKALRPGAEPASMQTGMQPRP